MVSKSVTFRVMQANDWPMVSMIYRQGIASSDATFETEVPEWDEWDKNHIQKVRIVAENKEQIVGWAALSPVSDRCVYQGVAEVSVYVAENARGGGVGKALLKKLIEGSEEQGIWTLQAGIFPENKASVTLHEKCGFRVIGKRERLGQLHGRWRDVLFLERRSSKTGL
jgi:L-amino acid N-acyltransferase YncA